jgi:hypothetical protein
MFLEADMLKMILVVAATAAPAFGAGIWTASTMAHDHSIEANVTAASSTISPYEMQLKVKPADIPVQYMQGDAF